MVARKGGNLVRFFSHGPIETSGSDDITLQIKQQGVRFTWRCPMPWKQFLGVLASSNSSWAKVKILEPRWDPGTGAWLSLSCDDSTSQCLLPYKATITRIEISRTVSWDFHRLSGRFWSDSCVIASRQSHRFRPDSPEPEPVLLLDSQAGCNSMIFPQVGIFSLFDTSPIFSPEHDFFSLKQNRGRLLRWWQWLINYIAISIQEVSQVLLLH